MPSGGLRRSRSRKSRAQKQTTGSVLPEHDVRSAVVEAENEERRETRLHRFARCVSAKVPLIHSIDAPNVGVLSAERPSYRRMPASVRPPHGAGLSCRQRSATPDGRQEHRRDVLAKEACFANRSGGNRFRRFRRFLYAPESGALFPKRPSPVRIIFGRNPCTDQKNVLHLHTDSRSSGFAVETVDVAQSVRVTDCGSEGRGFESHLPPSKLLK